jgi:carbamoyltransferase
MYILGISAFYHDSAACLYRNNTLLGAAEEERFTGIKGDSSFPTETIKWLLKSNRISKKDIDVVCWYENPIKKRERVIETFRKNPIKNIRRILTHLFSEKKKSIEEILLEELGFSKKIHFVDHHLSHASLAYFTSNFSECNIVTVDGVGEKETVTISRAKENRIAKLHSISYPHSLGLFYSAFTAFLGFKPNEGEYKVMGLASYGDPSIYYNSIKKTIDYREDKIIVNMKYFSWNYSDRIMFNQNLPILLDVPPRSPKDAIETHHKHIAASVQKIYEEILMEVIKFSYELNTTSNLCLGGGCAYNGVANSKISSASNYKNVWVPLSPSDGGSAIGACLHYINVVKEWKRKGSFDAYQGPSFEREEMEASIKPFEKSINYDHLDPTDLVFKCSNLLNEGNVIGWFQGKMEFGARALGNRSILASPLYPHMQDRINSVIKKREMFRPFAPSVTFDAASKFFEIEGPIPYMNMVVKVKEGWDLPAITHVDGTARVQTVTPYENPRFYRLLKTFGELSGYPILLNTSFNFKDQTITLYPRDAIIRFLDSEMDFLVLGNYLISKK